MDLVSHDLVSHGGRSVLSSQQSNKDLALLRRDKEPQGAQAEDKEVTKWQPCLLSLSVLSTTPRRGSLDGASRWIGAMSSP